MTLSHNINIGSFLFATEKKLLALMYLMPKGFPVMMNPEKKFPHIVVAGDADEVLSKDFGGSIYVLNDESFFTTPQEGLSDYEKVSKDTVTPVKEIEINSAIESLIEAGVSLYFVNNEVFNNLIGNPEQKEIISNLKKFNFSPKT